MNNNFEHSEPGAGSQEPGARSREPGARGREPGARSQEPGAGSQEPGWQREGFTRRAPKTGRRPGLGSVKGK